MFSNKTITKCVICDRILTYFSHFHCTVMAVGYLMMLYQLQMLHSTDVNVQYTGRNSRGSSLWCISTTI